MKHFKLWTTCAMTFAFILGIGTESVNANMFSKVKKSAAAKAAPAVAVAIPHDCATARAAKTVNYKVCIDTAAEANTRPQLVESFVHKFCAKKSVNMNGKAWKNGKLPGVKQAECENIGAFYDCYQAKKTASKAKGPAKKKADAAVLKVCKAAPGIVYPAPGEKKPVKHIAPKPAPVKHVAPVWTQGTDADGNPMFAEDGATPVDQNGALDPSAAPAEPAPEEAPAEEPAEEPAPEEAPVE
ncbi:MAG: hypothetical protein Q8S21_03330 [Candidatus Paracaedibacteraceae bacterium]|nr:hypothetical protein [Candidatus Paracaedibacteraceae bacterium]